MPGAMDGEDASFTLTFLDLFAPPPPLRPLPTQSGLADGSALTLCAPPPLEPGPGDDEVAVWDMSGANEFQVRLVEAAHHRIRCLLGQLGLQVAGLPVPGPQASHGAGPAEGGAAVACLLRTTPGGGHPLTVGQLNGYRLDLERRLAEPNVFDYKAQMERLMGSVVAVVGREGPEYFPPPALAGLYCQVTVPINEPWSVGLDSTFEGGQDHGNMVAYPNPYGFRDAIARTWGTFALRGGPGRLYRDYHFRCYRALGHEVVHCLQSKAKQVDRTVLSWSAEHDASYLSGSLLAAARHECLARPGAWEELLVTWLEELQWRAARCSAEVLSEYRAWRAAFGLHDVAAAAVDLPGTTLLFKDLVALEALREAGPDLRAQLAAVFQGRTGDVFVHGRPRMDGPVCTIDDDRTGLPALARPVRDHGRVQRALAGVCAGVSAGGAASRAASLVPSP